MNIIFPTLLQRLYFHIMIRNLIVKIIFGCSIISITDRFFPHYYYWRCLPKEFSSACLDDCSDLLPGKRFQVQLELLGVNRLLLMLQAFRYCINKCSDG